MVDSVMTTAWKKVRRLPPEVVILMALYVINVVALMHLDTGVIYPLYVPDEAEYALSAHNLLALHVFRYEGLFPALIPPLYPAVVAFGRIIAAGSSSSFAVSLLNHLLMEAVIFPAYAFAAQLRVARPAAILVAIAAAWTPAMWEADHYLSEVVYYPLFVTSCVIIVAYFQRPSARRALLAGALLGLALLTKNTGGSLLLAWGLACVGALAAAIAIQKPTVHDFIRSAHVRAYLIWPLFGAITTGLLYGPWYLWRSAALRSCQGCSSEASLFLQAIRHVDTVIHFLPVYVGDLSVSAGVLVLPLALLGCLGMLRESHTAVEVLAQTVFLGLIVMIVVAMAATFSGYTTGELRERHLFVLVPELLTLAGIGMASIQRQPRWRLVVTFTLVSAAEVGVFLGDTFADPSHPLSTPWSYVVNTPWIYGLGMWATASAHIPAPMDWNAQAFFLGLVVIAACSQFIWLFRPSWRASILLGATFFTSVITFVPVLEALAVVNLYNRTTGSGVLSEWLIHEIGPDQTLAFLGCDPLSPCYKRQAAETSDIQMLAYGQNYANIYYAEAAGMYEMVPVPDIQQLPTVERRAQATYLLSPVALRGMPEISHSGTLYLYDLHAYRSDPEEDSNTALLSSSGCGTEDETGSHVCESHQSIDGTVRWEA